MHQVWHSDGVLPLITVDGLRATLDDVTVLDVRFRLLGPPTRPDYDAGHIPGARFADIAADLSDPPGARGRHPIPDPARFEQAMRRLGVEPGRPVVTYDASDGQWASRAWWLLRYFGHEDVAVLDGGFAAWTAAGGAVTQVQPSDATTAFVAVPGGLPTLDADNAARVARDGLLLDARAGERYAGTSEPIDPVAGHIPGARSAPTVENVDVDGHFLRPDQLRERFTALGAGGGAEVGVYCGSGVTAAHEVLAFEVAGLPTPALYADSWSGWITDPSRPVATG